MIVSHKHRFIFIKTHKTASTSIEIALSKICGNNDIITPISLDDEMYRKNVLGVSSKNFKNKGVLSFWSKNDPFYNHMSAEEVQKRLGTELWDSYFKFTIERNSYDKAVSKYFWRKKGRYNTFDQFLDLEGKKLSDWGLYTDKSNRLMVDKVFQYEELGLLFEAISDYTGQDVKPISYKAKGNTRPLSLSYKQVINKPDKQILDCYFEREINFFKYSF